MLRSTYHLDEILASRPNTLAKDKYSSCKHSDNQSQQPRWAPKKTLSPGPYQWIKYQKSRRPEPFATRALTAVPHIDNEFSYDRKLTTADEPRLIRLLRVFPGGRTDPIACQLLYAALDKLPAYQALSYCWDDQPASVLISCNKQPILITANLSAAIATIRRESMSQLIWADALCIDQTSIEEKNSQVPLMRTICQRATTVHIWLGYDTNRRTGLEAFNVMRQLYSAYGELGWDYNMYKKPVTSAAKPSIKIPALDDPCWNSVLNLIRLPWFSRTWIIQEVAVSQEAFLHCGDATLEWDVFCLGFLFTIKAGLVTVRPDIFLHISGILQVASLLTTCICYQEQSGKELDMLYLFESHRQVQASDPRDKVFGLIGLAANEGMLHNVEPDYSLSVDQVYLDISKTIISSSSTLDILGIPRSPSGVPKPSWAVDWSSPRLASSLSCRDLHRNHIFHFDATGGSHSTAVEFRDKTLLLEGHLFDVITGVGKAMAPLETSSLAALASPLSRSQPGFFLTMMQTYEILQDWRELLKSNFPLREYPPTSEGLLQTWCRIIYLDQVFAGKTLADAIHNQGGIRIRASYHFMKFCARSKMITRLVRWYERIPLPGRMLMKAHPTSSPIHLFETFAKVMGRRMAVTRNGYAGLVPDFTQEGDSIAIVQKSKVPLVLRQRKCGRWELIGDCYVHGIMHGEGFVEASCERLEIV